MKFNISIENHYIKSKIIQVNANNESEAKHKAKVIFSFSGNEKHIKVNKY